MTDFSAYSIGILLFHSAMFDMLWSIDLSYVGSVTRSKQRQSTRKLDYSDICLLYKTCTFNNLYTFS